MKHEKLKQIFNKYSKKILEILFLFGPPMICFFILFQFTRDEFLNSRSEDFYKLIVGAIGITATLSGLTFRLSGIINDNKYKAEKYKEIGERFLHTVILFVMALIIKYSQINFVDSIEYIWLKNILDWYLKILLLFFFYYGIGYFIYALSLSHILLMKGNEKPYD